MNSEFECIVIGSSYGGIQALSTLLPMLECCGKLPIIVAQHISHTASNNAASCFEKLCTRRIKEASHGEAIQENTIYIAPSDYHLLVGGDQTLNLNADPRVNYSRPSIDELFETAAEVYQNRLIAILLTGANNDGTQGIITCHQLGGTTIAQSPDQATAAKMPQSAIESGHVKFICELEDIARLVDELINKESL